MTVVPSGRVDLPAVDRQGGHAAAFAALERICPVRMCSSNSARNFVM